MFEMFSSEELARKPDPSYENLGSVHEIAAYRSYEMAPMVGQAALLDVNRATGEVQISTEVS